MGKCKYCGLDAGFFSRSHKECRKRHEQGLSECIASLNAYFNGSKTISEAVNEVASFKSSNYLTDEEVGNCCQQSLKQYAESLSSTVGERHIQLVADFIGNMRVAQESLNKGGELDTLGERLYHGILSSHFVDKLPMLRLQRAIEQLSQMIPLSPTKENEIALTVLNKAAQDFLSDNIIDNSEQAELDDYTNALHLTTDNLPERFRGSDIEKLGQATILRKLQKGENPPAMNVALPIVLGAREYVVWVYTNVTMYQQKTVRQWVGGSSGVSVRIVKGVYYRTGATKGHPIEHSTWETIGVGSLVLTNKNVIFYSPNKSVKIPYNKLISYVPYNDGIELHKDGATAKPQIFQGFDSWFMVNFLSFINA